MNKKLRILFVCSGNSCRSPMAQGMLRAKLPHNLSQRVTVKSAGTLGINGQPATALAIQVAREYGADLRNHLSQGLSEELTEWADLILVMERAHLEFIKKNYPAAAERTHLLRAYGRMSPVLNGDEDIPDPIGGSLATYRECAHLIATELDRILPLLTELVEAHEPGASGGVR
ncbi:MAG: low molecular weight protein arginine phosphatase [Calditrichaeota bacterium]|nr:low molecular weight protein arginine phosphatase [Calditrichota bacterium]